MKKKREPPMAPAELRRLAEARLKEREEREGALPATEADALRTLHELEVHQIELELQNEELRRVQEQLEESRSRYFDLYDLAPVVYLTFSVEGVVLEANLTAVKVLGIEKGQLLGKPVGRFILGEDQAIYQSFLRKLLETCAPQVCELRVIGKGAEALWMQLDANLLRDAATGVSVCRVAMSDISARKQADEVLKHLSTHDALTGLHNRGFFMEELELLERGRRFPVSIVMADVDGLKQINDQRGHDAGDALLRRVAEALTASFRAEDVIARIGGDEFAVLLPATDASSGRSLVERVQLVIREQDTAHPETPLRISLGVSTAEKPAPLLAVLRDADATMYCQKGGRGTEKGVSGRRGSGVAEQSHDAGASPDPA